jgi:hypothetical protein
MAFKTTRTRTKVHCFCKKCKGLLVDPRTKRKHSLKYTSLVENNFDGINDYQETGSSNTKSSESNANKQSEAGPSNAEPSNDVVIDEIEYDLLPEITDLSPEIIEVDNNYFFLTKKLPIHESAKSQKVKKGKISDLVLENLLMYDESEDDDYQDPEDNNQDRNSEDSEDENGDDDEVNFESTEFDDEEPKLPKTNFNYNFTWIILWIFQYQQQYKLPDVAINSLFKFLKLVLMTIDENKFLNFPSTLYMAKKTLGISTNIIKYAACSKCHKLYNINEISNKPEILTCSFINHPQHSIERYRQKCNNPLTKKIDSNNNQIFCPIMTFSLVNIRQQLTLFFGRKNFEISCRKWAERNNETEALFDIYDGMIWKGFTDDNGELFFTKEYAETHIGLMINMD